MERALILDANSILYRAFHALPPLTTKKGELVNGVYGFLLVFFKAVREFQPDYIAACFDHPAPTFRHKKFKEYKISRPPTPKDLISQIPILKEILKTFLVPIFEKEGFEADDLIGTIIKQILEKQPFSDLEVIILSGDLDTLQLVNKNTKVFLLRKGVKETVLYDENLVKEKYGGLMPKQIVDFKALKGDPSDNIPGAKGIGEKTAIKIIKEFGNVENLYQNLEKINDKLKKLLKEQKETVFFSKELAEIKRNVPIDFDLKKCQWGKYEEKKVIEILKKFEFQSLIKRFSELKKSEKNVKIQIESVQKRLF